MAFSVPSHATAAHAFGRLVIAGALAACAGRAAPTTTPPDELDAIRLIEPGLYAMDFPGSSAKSTIVELEHTLVLLDVPVRDAGGGAALTDSLAGGERVLRSLARRFPDKPLAYVLSSHAHPHSLSAWRAFLDHGVTLVTTRANFAQLEAMLAPELRARAARLVRFVADTPLAIGDRGNPIIAHRFRRADYPSVPTEDYLYVELPRYDAVYTACMFDRWTGPPVAGRELLTRREADLHKLLTMGRTPPRRLLRLERERAGELLPFALLGEVVAHGISSQELAERYRGIATAALRQRRDELLQDAVRDGIPARVLNGLVYEALAQRQLARANELAVLQTLLAPADANAWDTLGETCYFRGAVELARSHGEHARRIDPGASTGEAGWQRDLVQHTRAWAAAGLVEPSGN